uniref:Nucleoporin Nup133/Nup155-like N-terminal domain-containing protein n=1 Tax=Eutreptiella gymnastica TaxID=73025 RepID=A0A7S4LJV6_9EUGL
MEEVQKALFEKIAQCKSKAMEGTGPAKKVAQSNNTGRLAPNDPHRPHFLKTRSQCIPPPIMDVYRGLRYKCDMGLFPSIKRAWIVVDNKLLLWNYETGDDLYMYDQCPQVIMAVGLVTPPINMLHQNVANILVLSTPSQIIFIAVGFRENHPYINSSNPYMIVDERHNKCMGELKLAAVTLTVATYEVAMTKIISTSKGRVFMGSENGHLYEVQYSTTEDWEHTRLKLCNHSSGLPMIISSKLFSFSNPFAATKRVLDLCIDEKQGYLYTLLQATYYNHVDSYIQAWSIGRDLDAVPQQLVLIKDDAAGRASLQGQSYSSPIVSIHVYQDEATSLRAHNDLGRDLVRHGAGFVKQAPYDLVGVTAQGARIYYKCEEASFYAGERLEKKAQETLDVVLDDGRPQDQALRVGYSWYNDNACLLGIKVTTQGEPRHLMFGISSQKDRRPGQADALLTKEVYVPIEDIAGEVLSICEVPSDQLHPELLSMRIPRSEVARQHLLPYRQFLVLTNQGLYTLLKLRLVDHLHLILTTGDPDLLDEFEKVYGTQDTVSLLLTVLASDQARSGPSSTGSMLSPFAPSRGPLPTSSYSGYDSVERNLFGGPTPGAHFGGPSAPPSPHALMSRSAMDTAAMAKTIIAGPSKQVQQDAATALLNLRRKHRAKWEDPSAHRSQRPETSFRSSPHRPAAPTGASTRELRSEMLPAFTMHFANIVAPFWDHPVFAWDNRSNRVLGVSYSKSFLDRLYARLVTMCEFLNEQQFLILDQRGITLDYFLNNFKNFNVPNTDLASLQYPMPSSNRPFGEQEAEILEKLLITQLYYVVQATAQAISFLKIIMEYEIAPLLSLQMADNARKATLKTMVKEEGLKGRQVPVMGQDWGTSHVGIMHEFVKAILQAEHLGNADPEAVTRLATELKDRCFLFFRHFHIQQYQGLQFIRQAALTGDPDMRAHYLEKSLQLFKENSAELYKDLPQICEQYARCGYLPGIVQLATDVAAKRDPNGLALRWYQSRQGMMDDGAQQPGEQEFADVWKCYEVGIESVLKDDASTSPEQQQQQRLQNIQYMLQYNIELWHYAIFTTLCSSLRLKDLLPRFHSPYLERFLVWNLKFGTSLMPELCKYCMSTGKYQQATHYYTLLATCENALDFSSDHQLYNGEDFRAFDLDERKMYLSYALNAAEIGGLRESADELIDWMKIATVQQEIWKEFQDMMKYLRGSNAWSVQENQQFESFCRQVKNTLCRPELMYTECKRYGQSLSNLADRSAGRPEAAKLHKMAAQLFQCALQILQICHPNESMERITEIYLAILQNSAAGDTLPQRVEDLVRDFYTRAPSPFFPMTLLISCLEHFGTQHLDGKGVVQVLVQAGVHWEHVATGYYKIFCTAHSPMMGLCEPLHREFAMKFTVEDTLQRIIALLQNWVDVVRLQQNEMLQREFRLHRLSLDNHIDDYLLKCRELKQHDLTAKFVKVKEDIKNIG